MSSMRRTPSVAAPPACIAANFAVGLENLDQNAVITFTQYNKFVLPVDGFVFWIVTTNTISVKGSLHYSADRLQNEDETFARNGVIFSAESQVTEFNNVSPTTMYLATLPDGVQYAFSSRGKYYQPADEYHYSGIAVVPALQSQIINTPIGFDETSEVVTNSLPFWLALNTYVPPYPGFQFPAGFLLYPSFIVPDNLSPPYGVVHIEPSATDALQSAPYYDASLTPWLLCKDTVRITIYGLRNADAQTVYDTICQYSYDYNNFGLMSTPAIRDEKRTQTEMAVIAMKKTMVLDVSYNQITARDVARQMIEKVNVTYLPQPYTAAGFGPPAP